MTRLVIRWLILAAAIALAVKIVPGVHLQNGLKSLLGVAAVFGVINLVIGTVVRVVSLPIRILTIGLFSIVINAALLELTARADNVLTLDNFGSAVLAAIVISIVSAVLSAATALLK
jgi:putative membrane protein